MRAFFRDLAVAESEKELTRIFVALASNMSLTYNELRSMPFEELREVSAALDELITKSQKS